MSESDGRSITGTDGDQWQVEQQDGAIVFSGGGGERYESEYPDDGPPLDELSDSLLKTLLTAARGG